MLHGGNVLFLDLLLDLLVLCLLCCSTDTSTYTVYGLKFSHINLQVGTHP